MDLYIDRKDLYHSIWKRDLLRGGIRDVQSIEFRFILYEFQMPPQLILGRVKPR